MSPAASAKSSPDIEGCEIEAPEPTSLIIIGASGDLAKRKIVPSLFRLGQNGLLPDGFLALGAARTEMSDGDFRAMMKEAVKTAHPEEFSEEAWEGFSEKLFYERVDYSDAGSFDAIKKKLPALENRFHCGGNRIFYLAVPPGVYGPVITNLGVSGLSVETGGYTHLMVEKPFGSDLDSAVKLNTVIKKYFQERQVYRMDHYLAKETVQDILIFRFANSIFEPLWNRNCVDHVQITVSETLGIGHRAGYYETAGVLRDMFQNHIFQLMALTAMEPPAEFEADKVRDEKIRVFGSVRRFPLEKLEETIAAGQYASGAVNENDVPGYREEPGVADGSTVPTFAALKVFIDNERWSGVPFYLRSGKRLGARKAEISVHFKPVSHRIFASEIMDPIEPNTLVLRLQPEEGIGLSFQTKRPGSRLCLKEARLGFSYGHAFSSGGYERVLLDAMNGDQMLFVRQDGVESSWELLTPLIERIEERTSAKDFPNYRAGSDGPEAARALIERDGRKWRDL